ncbi:MAG: leucine-rich repeat domain-containing protein, partial [Treponema sp.]|nr:leucine-rich repeat domain-containing protein [Treponema sp.]
IPNGAFRNTGLTEITIPEDITSIGGSAFYGCSRLRTVNFNARNCMDFISTNDHFGNCQSLRTVIFGDNVRRIPNHALSGIASLESITIGSRVNEIGNNAFARCTGLDEIINKAASPQTVNANVFDRVDITKCKLKVPAASLNTYRNAAVWKDFGTITQ